MADPSTTAAATAATGITIFGVATGIDPSLLLAGLSGGWLALYQFEVFGLASRFGFVVLSALLGAMVGPVAGSVALAMLEKAEIIVPASQINIPMAIVVGLLSIRVIGPRLVGFAQRAKLPGDA